MTSIYEKLRAVQVELKAGKDRRNDFGKYAYRNVEDVLEAAKPLLNQHGLTLVITDDIVQVGDRIYVKATSTVYDGDGGSVSSVGWAREAAEKRGTDESQRTGMASSYSRKYSIGGLLLLDDGDDADAHDNRATDGASQATRPSAGKPATSKPPFEGGTELADRKRLLGQRFENLHIPPADVKKKLADLGFEGLSKVNDPAVLDELDVWASERSWPVEDVAQ